MRITMLNNAFDKKEKIFEENRRLRVE